MEAMSVKDTIKDAIYNKMFELLMKNRKEDVVRAINAGATAEKREKRSKELLKWYLEKAGEMQPLTDEQLAAVKETWKDIWDTGVVKPEWVQIYTNKTGEFDPTYVGSDLHYYYTEWNKIDFDYLRAFLDKNYMDIVLPCIKHPVTLIRKVHGLYMDADFNKITLEDAINILEENKDPGAVVKISRMSCGGAGVQFIGVNSTREDMKKALETDRDMAVQRVMKQHPEMAKMNESSVNTVRIICMMIDGESVPLSACVRIGNSGSRVDNFSSGGVGCGVQPDGSLNEYGYTQVGVKSSVHTNGFVFKEGKVPNFDKALEAVKRCHYRVPMFGVASWDIAIDEDGEPTLIEYNVGGAGIDIHQYNNGPLYGQYREKVINEVFKNYSVRRGTLDYNYAIKRDGVRITKGGSGMRELTIPAEIEGKRVTVIDRNAFNANQRLKTLTVEADLKEIAYCAFYRSRALSQVTFKGGVEVFGRSCFNGCGELTSIKLPEGTKKICTMAFRNCKKLANIVIPASVETIEDDVFIESPNVVVYCKKDSAAHKYAVANKLKFQLA